jgi:hypothetical protein
MKTLILMFQPRWEWITLLVVGVGLFVAGTYQKRIRLATGNASPFELPFRVIGLLLIICSFLIPALYLAPEADDDEQEQPAELEDFSDTTPGCSRPTKRLKEFKPGE